MSANWFPPLNGLFSINEQLRQENEHMRNQLEYIGNSDPGDLNRPAKRSRTDYYGWVDPLDFFGFAQTYPRRNSFSSPRRMSTPIRPDRLTFPPDHQEPNLSRSDDGYQNDTIPQNERPGSRRFQQFVHQSCHGINSPRFVGSTRTTRLEHHNKCNRRRSPTTKDKRWSAPVNHPHLRNSTNSAVTTTMGIHTHTLTTRINIVKLCHPLQPRDAIPRKCRFRL